MLSIKSIIITESKLSLNGLYKILQGLMIVYFCLLSTAVFPGSNTKQQTLPLTLKYKIFHSSGDIQPPEKTNDVSSWLFQMTPVNKVKLTGGTFWYYSAISPSDIEKQWVLDVTNSIVENINFYLFSQKEKLHLTSGYYDQNEYDFHYGRTVTLEADTPYELLVRLDSRYFASQPRIEIYPLEAYRKTVLFDSVLVISSLGTLLALGLYNLFVYAGSREKSHLYYALYLFTYFSGWALVFQVPNNLFDWQLLELTYIPFFLLPLVGAYFCTTFLQLEKYQPKLAKVLKINGFISLALSPCAIFLMGYAHGLATITIGVWIIAAIVAGVQRWRGGFRPAAYFVLAFMSLLIPACFILPANIGLFPDILDNAELVTLIGGTVDAIFLAFALADRLAIVTQKNLELTSTLEQTVETRTTELRKANSLLEKTNSDLIEASNAKGRFLATMSHEIRTPLTSIIGYADGILLGDIDKAEQERVTKIIAENGNHLLSVINDILDISKIEANKLDFESIPTPLFSVLAQVESIVGKRARDKGLAFHLEYEYPLPAQIITDPTRLKQILFNLTNNAIKFTEQGFIGLSVSLVNNRLQIKVKDSGEGISTHQQEQLFQPFTQADSSINRRFGGTGLGLSISRRLANGLGGDITVFSAPRKGSTFILDIDLFVVQNSPWINNVGEIWESTPTKSVKPTALPNFVGNNVLLADDHPNNRELISILLKRMNITVTEVENGKQALETIFYQKFDLILLDIHMPQMDGTDALKQIRAAGNFTPVIALTANNMKHEIEHYMRLGFSDHLAKPISRHHFISKLSLYLNKQGEIDSPLHEGDMLKLIKDYQQDLREQVVNLQRALEQRDLTIISEIAHRIRGSAGSFGFDIIGQKFADIEKCALQDDEIAVTYELPNVMALTKQCIELPGVDIAQGIVRHHNSAKQFLGAIFELVEHSQQTIKDLTAALDNNEINSALVHLYKFFPASYDCALIQSESAFKAIENIIKQGNVEPQKYSPHLDIIRLHLAELREVLQSNLVDEI
jgi:signal transduction histidine kinase/CheY-like chemotaxis protein